MASRAFGPPWIALSLALAAHVADEAATDFLSVYNPAVSAIRARLPFLPLPVFTFEVWLAGLIAGIVLLFAATPFAFRGSPVLRAIALPVAVLMCLNGLGHLAGSVYLGRPMPGVVSAPFLLAAALWLLWAVRPARCYTAA